MDSIRSFDAESQRSLENLDEIAIYPAAEWNDGKEYGIFSGLFSGGKNASVSGRAQPSVWKTDWAVEEEYAAEPHTSVKEKGEKNTSGSVAL